MIQVLERALEVIKATARADGKPVRLSEIAQMTGLNNATTARILKTLTASGFIEQVSRKEGYILGQMIPALAALGNYKNYLVETAEPLMRELSQQLDENIQIAVLRQRQRVILREISGKQQVQVKPVTEQSTAAPLTTATGRLLTAYLDEKQQREIMAATHWQEQWPEMADKTDEQRLAFFTTIRETGQVVRETSSQVIGLAVPIWQGQHVEAALGVYLPAFRFAEKQQHTLFGQMKQCAQQISEGLKKFQMQ